MSFKGLAFSGATRPVSMEMEKAEGHRYADDP
jgi:hypothetical protein